MGNIILLSKEEREKIFNDVVGIEWSIAKLKGIVQNPEPIKQSDILTWSVIKSSIIYQLNSTQSALEQLYKDRQCNSLYINPNCKICGEDLDTIIYDSEIGEIRFPLCEECRGKDTAETELVHYFAPLSFGDIPADLRAEVGDTLVKLGTTQAQFENQCYTYWKLINS